MYLFILERKSEQRRGREGERERERERIPSRLHIVSTELDAGLELTNREIMTWAEIKSQTDVQPTEPPRCPISKGLFTPVAFCPRRAAFGSSLQ